MAFGLTFRALSLWITSLALLLLQTRAQSVDVSINTFKNLPAKLYFFDDTTVVAYHDIIEGNLWISDNEGKSWERTADIPEGAVTMFFEHPFNNRMGFALTRGKTHYRTDDRGKTWRTLEVPVPPAFMSRPLSFHSDPAKNGYILYQGVSCVRQGWGEVCHDETYYTKEAFSDRAEMLLSETSRCQFAHSSKDFKHDAHPDLIYCVGFETWSTSGSHSLSSSRLFSSTDFFRNDITIEDLGIGKNARGVLALAIVSKFAVVALKDLSPGAGSDMLLYVSVDTKTWAKAQFPQSSSARLRENGYTIVESTTHSLAVDVLLQDASAVGTLFVSNSNGTFFVESLKDTNRNEMGFVDYENLYGVEGVGIANVVGNAQDVEGRGAEKQLKTVMTFDDGSSWAPIRAPSEDSEGRRIGCNPADTEECALHLHSVTLPHNFGRVFSSPAPGFVMGVGSVGKYLLPYEECDTFLSTDAGVSWKMIRMDAHKYEFGDQGSILVVINDEEFTDTVRYSTDLGRTWQSLDIGIKVQARALSTVQDSTSQKFLLIGQLSRQDAKSDGRYVTIFLDFAPMRPRQCGDDDFEPWFARTAKGKECLMGHKQWYRRRKPDANCYVGNKFEDPIEHEENCPCEDEDYECDYNFVRHEGQCVPVGPEPIPAGICADPRGNYQGSSGYRIIPGNTCDRDRGIKKDEKVEKPCSQAQPQEGDVIHQTFEFPAKVVQHAYFKDSTTILVRLDDKSMWQSSNEGYTWNQLLPGTNFLAFYHHSFTPDRAYLITDTKRYHYTTDGGRSWNELEAPYPPNSFGLQVLHFNPVNSDYLIWTGNVDCASFGDDCHAEAYYTRDNGRRWDLVEKYVRNCAWARDSELLVDPSQIICESYRDKQGSQRFFGTNNPLELISGTQFFGKKTKLFDQVVGFAKFSEYLIVAEYLPQARSLDLQVSLDGRTFAAGMFPPNMRPEQHAYTILESSTDSVFLHMTTSEPPSPYWGNILKSNWNGTYYGLSIENVNRDERGYVDFEKMIGLDGIALINVVGNPGDAAVTGAKKLQTRITHNDGGSWKALIPPKVDSMGSRYSCSTANCALHVHGYTERTDPRATFSSPSVVGLIMAVGNVGEDLVGYTDSDTFLSRDAGFTWEEVHKDAHLWEFGDSGSILIMANDEEPTDHVLFTTDEGLNWREYTFTDEKLRVTSIVTVPSDTSRRFILMGQSSRGTVAVHLDFTSLTTKQCVLDVQDPGHDDFELWSPSEERNERCLFGRQTLYHRRVRDRNCVVGSQEKAADKVVKNCACTASDFECEFNYARNSDGQCVLASGTQPLPPDDSCRNGEDYWYDRTAYRKIPYSTCEDGLALHQGSRHVCPGIRAHGAAFWFFVLVLPFIFTASVAWWYYRKSGLARGMIRLPGDTRPAFRSDSGFMSTLASVPWFMVGLAGIAWERISSTAEGLATSMRSRRGYRNIPVDEDAQILRFEDEE
ncbi:Oligoxyloglucan reducing end-specific cellobiohydrolase [Stereum hirsutum FP-91666 SS1]|uniref:Vacuolar protein sorting/targeting protein 10 n=1 Tax=Stereum hirsutum (strain FP-91666) TaxID=721885 RepID=R7RXZ6_STEHR|nr:Oligoxyloglucan reducing end-specific cellobiohydrolase [Stereum hirsutum FP-91666 SS1]EIM80281.1 Oligoxyloglucan reducing end-specific cellobiohydrolase [Stereum hirsutum FP-91666 SS1]